MKDLSTRNVITRCNSLGGGEALHDATAIASHSFTTCCYSYSPSCISVLSKLSNDSSTICSRHAHNFCHICQLGHHTRKPFVCSSSRVDNNFDLIHCDLWTSPIVSISGYKYYLIILDDCSHFVCTFPCRSNSIFFVIPGF
jgi:hypothetical protein